MGLVLHFGLLLHLGVFDVVRKVLLGRKALIAEEKIVRAALEAVVSGDSWHDDEARKCAESTLSLLFPSARPTDREKLHRESVDPGTRHIMMSCECN